MSLVAPLVPRASSAHPPRAPSPAERCRTLAARARHGVLSTLAREPAGHPFGSLVALACDPAGRPLLLLSAVAEHTQNLLAASEACLLVTVRPGQGHEGGATERDRDPLALRRATLVGACTRIEEESAARVARDTFLSAHPEATANATSKDFAMYRLQPAGLRYVGGFDRMSSVNPDDYAAAQPDPLADTEARMIEHMNDDHSGAVLAYAKTFAGIADAMHATMTAIDRYGFELLAVTADGEKRARIAFPADVTTTDGARRALVALARDARPSRPSSP